MLAHCVGGNAFLRNVIFVGVVATAGVFVRHQLREQEVRVHWMNYSCFTATRSPISVHWEVNGSQAFDRKQFEIFYSPMDTIGPESKLVFARYSTLTIRKTVGTTVRCIIQQYQEEHSNRSLRVTRRVTLSTISTVAKANGDYLHVTYGQPCPRRTPNCVTEHASCSVDIKPIPICLCDSGYRYVDQMRTCVALRQHNSPCILGYPCALPVDKCDGRCRCRRPFLQDASGCRMNTTLNSGCDQYRLCPEGAHCVNNVCACRPGYVPWGFGCLRRFLSGDGMHKVHAVIRFTLTAVFTVAMVLLGVWLYHHSHSPSLMRERSVANWEYMPKMDQT
ncbi:hypothetical protein MRX96_047625 [Rhipicephalus microplus]